MTQFGKEHGQKAKEMYGALKLRNNKLKDVASKAMVKCIGSGVNRRI